MRTINIFGRKMPVLAILMALLVIGTASAAVVSYLSNEGNAEVTVESPFSVQMSATGEGDSYSTELLQLDSKYGGQTSTFFVRFENLADQPIDMEIITTIMCDGGNALISEADFDDGDIDGITIEGSLNDMPGYTFGPDGINEDMDDNEFQLTLETFTSENILASESGMFPAESYAIIQVTLHHSRGARGTYTISTQVFNPDAPEYLED